MNALLDPVTQVDWQRCCSVCPSVLVVGARFSLPCWRCRSIRRWLSRNVVVVRGWGGGIGGLLGRSDIDRCWNRRRCWWCSWCLDDSRYGRRRIVLVEKVDPSAGVGREVAVRLASDLRDSFVQVDNRMPHFHCVNSKIHKADFNNPLPIWQSNGFECLCLAFRLGAQEVGVLHALFQFHARDTLLVSHCFSATACCHGDDDDDEKHPCIEQHNDLSILGILPGDMTVSHADVVTRFAHWYASIRTKITVRIVAGAMPITSYSQDEQQWRSALLDQFARVPGAHVPEEFADVFGKS